MSNDLPSRFQLGDAVTLRIVPSYTPRRPYGEIRSVTFSLESRGPIYFVRFDSSAQALFAEDELIPYPRMEDVDGP